MNTNRIGRLGRRYEIRCGRIGSSLSVSKILYAGSYVEPAEKPSHAEKEANKVFRELVGGARLKSLSDSFADTKTAYVNLTLCRVIGGMWQGVFHPVLYVIEKEGYIPLHLLKRQAMLLGYWKEDSNNVH